MFRMVYSIACKDSKKGLYEFIWIYRSLHSTHTVIHNDKNYTKAQKHAHTKQ